jgi:hypothetical protein
MTSGNPAAGGGNPSGFNVNQVAPMPVGNHGGQMGVPGPSNNPMISPMPSQQQWPGMSSPYSFPANGTPGPMSGVKMGQAMGVNADNSDQIRRGFIDAGVPSGLASLMAQFMQNGAGYNPAVLQQLFAQLQPQINRGAANINEQFGSMGLGMSSPAAIGLGDFYSQVNLNEGQMASQLYEDSVKNYMQVLLGGSGYQSQSHPGYWENLGEALMTKTLGSLTSFGMGKIPGMGGGGGGDLQVAPGGSDPQAPRG